MEESKPRIGNGFKDNREGNRQAERGVGGRVTL